MDGATPRDSELLLILTPLKNEICERVNEAVGRGASFGTVDVYFNLDEFAGTYTDQVVPATDTSSLEDDYKGTETACIATEDGYGIFYNVLLAR